MSYLVGVYWGPRRETREACAERIATFLQAITILDPGLSRWYKQMSSKKSPLRPIPYDKEGIAPLLTTNNTDIPKRPIIELGFDFSCWAGFETPLRSSISVTCGMFVDTFPNSALVKFESEAQPSIDLLSTILKTAVAAFDPDDGIVNSRERLRAGAPLIASKIPALIRYKRGKGYSENE